MTNVIDKITSLYPISDDTIRTLKESVTICHFPKKTSVDKGKYVFQIGLFHRKGNNPFFLACKWRGDNNFLFMGRRNCL